VLSRGALQSSNGGAVQWLAVMDHVHPAVLSSSRNAHATAARLDRENPQMNQAAIQARKAVHSHVRKANNNNNRAIRTPINAKHSGKQSMDTFCSFACLIIAKQICARRQNRQHDHTRSKTKTAEEQRATPLDSPVCLRWTSFAPRRPLQPQKRPVNCNCNHSSSKAHHNSLGSAFFAELKRRLSK
jgi:hypothetical protein